MRELTAAEVERFWSKVLVRGPGECWPWQGAIFQKTGYGMFKLLPRTVLAHRVAFKLAEGRDPDPELVLDHKCHMPDTGCPGGRQCFHRPCCNRSHLREKTHAENIGLGLAPSSVLARAGVCKAGHDLRLTGAWRLDKGVLRLRCQVCKTRWNVGRHR